jgi:hypothetical protein
MPFDKLTQTGPLSGELNQGRNVLERIVINQLGRIDIQAHPVLYLRNGAPIDRPYTDNGGEDTGEACSDKESKDKAALQV